MLSTDNTDKNQTNKNTVKAKYSLSSNYNDCNFCSHCNLEPFKENKNIDNLVNEIGDDDYEVYSVLG